MKHILIEDAIELRRMIVFAVNHDAEAELGKALIRLFLTLTGPMVEHPPGPPSFEPSAGDTLAIISNDFAAYSLRFVVLDNGYAQTRGGAKRHFNGGFVYEGPGHPLDGSFPSLTMSVGRRETLHAWGVHT
jgi:hypothetical protein